MTLDVVKESLQKTGFSASLLEEILRVGRLKKAKVSQTVMDSESASGEIPFVISGLLKVIRKDEQGNELLLYMIGSQETCAMSITCCLDNRKTGFQLRAEQDSVLWMVPMSEIDTWLKKYDEFRRYVLIAYQNRFEEMMQAIDSLAFTRMDERVMKYLLDSKQATGSFEIQKTHQQIADDLNTSRVVVSRILKKLENEGKIEQYRNRIDIL